VFRRLARHAFTLLSALSLLLCVAVCAAAVDSFWTYRELHWQNLPGPGFVYVISDRGRVWALWQRDENEKEFILFHYNTTPSSEAGHPEEWDVNNCHFSFRVFGAGVFEQRFSDGEYPLHEIVVPYWMLAAVFALWPGFRIVRLLRCRSRHQHGRCPACGYDLRAHAGGGPAMSLSNPRCPECGAGIGGPA
jgi:hypothetical protein